MNVEILNPDVLTNLYKNHGDFARVCYDTPTGFAERVGQSCQDDGHMSGSRCEYIKFRISGIDRGTAEQCLRHEIGTFVPFEDKDNYTNADYSEVIKDVSPDQIVKNMASFRYIDKNGFSWSTPAYIEDCKVAKDIYDNLMTRINEDRRKIKEALVESGYDEKAATQDANFVLPRATETEFVIGFTPEAFIHFCHKRMCNRAQEFIRELAGKMRDEVAKYNERFAREAKPQCMHLLWCPEGKRSCGMMPSKEQARLYMAQGKRAAL